MCIDYQTNIWWFFHYHALSDNENMDRVRFLLTVSSKEQDATKTVLLWHARPSAGSVSPTRLTIRVPAHRRRSGEGPAEGRMPGPDNNSSVSSIILVILFMLCFAFLLFRT